MHRLVSYLRFDPASAMALVDAIVFNAQANLVSFDGIGFEFRSPLATAVKVAEDVRRLPESCAMRDGRKWKTIPFIVFANAFDEIPFYIELPDRFKILPPVLARYPYAALRTIRQHVDEYHDQILKDYISLGILVQSTNGHVQIHPALKKRDTTTESAYYYADADKRSTRRWVTVKRDQQGLKHDIEVFQYLIEQKGEREMHRFLEEHPAFLMEAFRGVPLSHRPTLAQPKGNTPDYSILPILGPLDNRAIELLELKGPSEPTLQGRLHRGFTRKVHAAVDQVRDYERYMQDPVNSQAIRRSVGYIPTASNLAVLIGRTPRNESDQEIFLRRETELGVKIVTYDEILQVQADQVHSALDIYW